MRRHALLVPALLLLLGGARQSAPSPEIALTLRPATSGGGTEIDRIDIALTFSGLAVPAGQPVVQLPLVVSNSETIAAAVTGAEASDARGALTLSPRESGSGDAAIRQWVADRATEGTLSLRYSAPITGRTASRGAAPPIELRSEAGAFSGAGSTFLLLPPNPPPARLSVRWDLSALPTGATGASSLGIGAAATAAPQPSSRLARSFFMAGAIGRHPPAGREGPFFAAWQGAPPFDAAALMAWTGGLHARYAAFFRVADPPPYGVFLRHNPVNAGGGVGLLDSFVTTFGPQTDPQELKLTLAHEMFHTFSPMLASPSGLESSWFSEGLAVFYARTLALRFGAIGPDDFLRDLNSHAGRFYTNAFAEAPNAEVPRRFWADTRIRVLPYDRGSLYFALVDDQMRKASRGRRSLDDLMLAMVERQRAGRVLSNADWEALLRQQLGPPAVAAFRSMLAGRIPVPASDAFGPCFRRTTRPLRRYVLGFEPAVLTEPRRIVRGLIPGSAAAQAGLRDGDEIVRPVPQDGIQADQTALLRLEIRRDGRVFPLPYLPRGETVMAYQWERVPGRRDASCAR